MPAPISKSGLQSHPRIGRRMVVALIAMLAIPVPPALAASPAPVAPATPEGAKAGATKLNANQRVVHLLNRLSFGPTPEEIAAVKRLGVDGWLNQQLHPERISDNALEARLEQFPALQLPVALLLQRFPNGAEIRQTANGKLAMPGDPVLKAIYGHQVALYQAKQEEKAKQNSKEGDSASMATDGAQIPTVGNMTSRTTSIDASGAATAPQTTSGASPVSVGAPVQADMVVKTVLGLTPEQRVSRVLAMQPAQYEQFHDAMKGPQRLRLLADLTPEQRELLEDFDNPTHAVVEEQQAQRLLRDIYSSRQLQEVMTSFWLNHFNVYLHKNEQEPYYLSNYERDVIRPRALGNFEDLLIAIAESPAMLLYLDNSESTGPDSAAAEKQKQREAAGKQVRKNAPQGLNENYARELMELHTLGVNGGYTQRDVTEVAKVFTGWTVNKPGQGGGFEFDGTRHEPGTKRVLGKTINDDGQNEGLEVLHMLATSPATARFISQELAVAFVSDTPSSKLINRMAKTFLSSDGNISAVLRTMVHAPEFWSSDTYQAKIKTPLEYVVSAARASGAEITNTQPLVNALNQMGMPLYACVPPTGYPAKAADWVSTGALVTRMNFALSLATNHFPGIKVDGLTNNSTATDSAAMPELFEKELEARLLPLGVSEKTRAAVLNQIQPRTVEGSSASMGQKRDQEHQQAQPKTATIKAAPVSPASPTAADWQYAQMAGLLIGSPEFQKR